MKFTALLALATGALAVSSFYDDDVETSTSAAAGVTYTTEVVTAITTYCPEPTEVTYGGSTYTITTATTLTITDCPCTIKRPITTISSVICNKDHWCPSPSYHNSTSAAPVPQAHQDPVGTVSLPSPSATKPPIATGGAGKTAALSGGALAGLLGLAAFIL
ncbi:hypothetical protein N0V88_000924 [Collariella sp. IMI 366227]|nr:hypothetical protein N0V88_000924 [Collariella sp. IMI 366227]